MCSKIICVMCKVLTGVGLVRRTPTHPTVTCTTVPIFNNVFESFKIFTCLDMKRKGVPDFRPIVSQTFSTITSLIDSGKTES